MRACVRKKISLRRYRRPISRNGTLSFFSPPFANLAENSRRIEDRRNRVRERILEDNCLLFIPFGTVWLSQFALPVSRMYRTLAPSILSLSLSSSLHRILSFFPVPPSGCRISPERFESNRSKLFASFSNTWPLLSGFVHEKRGKNETVRNFSLSLSLSKLMISRNFKRTLDYSITRYYLRRTGSRASKWGKLLLGTGFTRLTIIRVILITFNYTCW